MHLRPPPRRPRKTAPGSAVAAPSSRRRRPARPPKIRRRTGGLGWWQSWFVRFTWRRTASVPCPGNAALIVLRKPVLDESYPKQCGHEPEGQVQKAHPANQVGGLRKDPRHGRETHEQD